MAKSAKAIKKPVAASVKAVEKPVAASVKAVKKPVHRWQQSLIDTGAIFAKPWRRYRGFIFQGYLIAAIVIFLILAVLAHTVAYFTFDVTITQELQKFKPDWFSALMYALTWIGFAPQVDVISLLVVIFLFASGLKWETVVTFVNVIGISILGTGIKLLVGRARPTVDLVSVISQLSDYSFPSGHVLYFTAFFGFLAFLTFTLVKHAGWRWLLLVLFGGMIVLIGPSRIYVGQHWASDVLAAYLLGTIWLALTVYFYRWGKTRFFVDEPVAKEQVASSSVKG
jgi:membrane-associated phospholipid phosphatase